MVKDVCRILAKKKKNPLCSRKSHCLLIYLQTTDRLEIKTFTTLFFFNIC